jgi:hypothetical protein
MLNAVRAQRTFFAAARPLKLIVSCHLETSVRTCAHSRYAVWIPLALAASASLGCVGHPPASGGVVYSQSQPLAINVMALVGLWQLPHTAVWIHIKDDGSAFECRRGASGQLCVAHGHFSPPDSIDWDTCWGTEKIEYSPGVLTIHSNGHAFAFVRTDKPMALECIKVESGS